MICVCSLGHFLFIPGVLLSAKSFVCYQAHHVFDPWGVCMQLLLTRCLLILFYASVICLLRSTCVFVFWGVYLQLLLTRCFLVLIFFYTFYGI